MNFAQLKKLFVKWFEYPIPLWIPKNKNAFTDEEKKKENFHFISICHGNGTQENKLAKKVFLWTPIVPTIIQCRQKKHAFSMEKFISFLKRI